MVTWILLAFLLLIFTKYVWNRRWLYYYSSKLEGLVFLPLIGSEHLHPTDLYEKMLEFGKLYPPVFKLWMGQDLLIIVTQPSDVEIILNTCLNKGKTYDLGKNIMRDGILVAPVAKWKKNRKIINPTFNFNILNDFICTFNQHAKKLTTALKDDLRRDSFDILLRIFCCTLDTSIETLIDVDPDLITGKDSFIENIIRMERIFIIRIFRIWLHSDFIFRNSSIGKEFFRRSDEICDFIKQIIDIKKSQLDTETNNANKQKHFLNYLFNVHRTQNLLTENEICEEVQNMLVTSSESTAYTVSMVLLVLGIRPDIQKIVNEEMYSIFGVDNNRDANLEDIKRMKYLECVIKETLRLFPTAPILLRSVERNLTLDTCTIPAGCDVLIPVMNLHKHPDLWINPEKFDPDRFLFQETVNKRHRCAYIPFSYGMRNCIGWKYGMMSMKVILSTLLRHYTFYSDQAESVEDIKCIYNVLCKPIKGYNVKIELINNTKIIQYT